MNLLPDKFPVDSLKPIEEQKVQWFYQRFAEEFGNEYGQGHFILAAYASIPLLLTPDLLYKLWQNFNGYKWMGMQKSIHRISVSDILLSPFCHEVGLELYEMDTPIRMAFLEWLHKESNSPIGRKRGIKRIDEIAHFVEQYHSTLPVEGNRWGDAYSESQQIEAISYSQPAVAAQRIIGKLNSTSSETEMLRTMNMLVNTRQRLARIDLKQKIDSALLDNQVNLMQAWISLIQRNQANFLQQLNHNRGLLNLLKDTGGQGIRITIDEGTVEKIDLITERKVKCLAVATSEADNVNMQSVGAAIRHAIPQAQLEITELENTSPDEIIGSLNSFSDAGLSHDLLFYISASRVKTTDSGVEFRLSSSRGAISVSQIGSILKNITASSLTVIVDMEAAIVIDDWISVVNTQHILISIDNRLSSRADSKQPSNFSWAVSQCLEKVGLAQSNRNFFLRMLAIYKQKSSAGSIDERTAPLPRIFAHSQTMNRFFLQGRNELIELQWELRRNGFYDGLLTGQWDRNTALSLEEFKRKYPGDTEKSKRDYINRLSSEYRQSRRTERPIWLLIFSDPGPEKKLKGLVPERAEILKLIRSSNNEIDVEVIILDDPNRLQIEEVFSRRENRNKIEIINYSGYDKHGEMVLTGGVYPFVDMAPLLKYQENIHLFVSNTCRSSQVAAQMADLGVKYAIGSAEVIDDDYGKDFGISLFKAFVDKIPLSQLSGLTKVAVTDIMQHRGQTNSFLLFSSFFADGEGTWPEPWHQRSTATEKKANRLLSVIMGLGESRFIPPNRLLNCASNTERFREQIKNYQPIKGRTIINGSSFGNGPTRAQAFEASQLLEDAVDGDTIIFYYSGAGSVPMTPSSRAVHDLFFIDDTADYLNNGGRHYLDWVHHVLSNKRVNILMILDLHEVNSTKVQNPLVWSNVGSMVTIYDIQGGTYTNEQKSSNAFSEALFDAIAFDRKGLTYEEFFNRVINSKAQLTSNDPFAKQPLIIYDPASASNFRFLTGSSTDINEPVHLPKKLTRKQFEEYAKSIYHATPVLIDDDLQKNRWGGRAKVDSNSLSAEVTKKRTSNFTIKIKVRASTDQHVAVFLHNTFDPEIEFKKILNGFAELEISAYESFTIGAYLEDGTMLELDLGETPGYPADFYPKPVIFNEKWILVTGTGTENISNEEKLISETIGQVLAENGYGVICGGWPGIDSVVSQSFSHVLKAKNLSEKSRLIQLIEKDQKVGYEFGELRVLEEKIDWYEEALKGTFALIMIGGKGGTFLAYEKAIEKKIPIIPIAQTGGDALKAFKRVNKESNFVLSLDQLNKIEHPINSQKDAQLICNSIIKILEQLENYRGPIPKAVFKSMINEIYRNRPATIERDIQKNRWGAQVNRNGKILKATVEKSKIPLNYVVKLWVESTSELPLNGNVAFFLPIGSYKEIDYTVSLNGKAEIQLISHKAFTVGAFTEDETMLELDLEEQNGYPQGFYNKDNGQSFRFYSENEINNLIQTSKSESNEVLNNLLLFQTKTQQTWLVFTHQKTFIVLDDAETRKNQRSIMTSFSKSKTLPIKCKNSERNAASKIVQFSSQDTWWYYSKHLFPSPARLREALELQLLTILWVDDNPKNNTYERDYFQKRGFKFDLAISTDQALKKLQLNKYFAIISDMGRVEGPREGYVLLNIIRKNGNHTPFFIYAGSNDPSHKKEARQNGAQGSTNSPTELFKMVKAIF